MKKLFFVFAMIGALFVSTPVSYAQTSTADCKTLQQQIESLGGSKSKEAQEFIKKFPKHCTASDSIGKIMNYALTFAGIAAVLAIMYGGFMMITSAGNEETFGKGKKTATWAIGGLILILLAGLIVNLLVRTVGDTFS